MTGTDDPPPLSAPSPLPALPARADLPPLPSIGPVTRRLPEGGARREWLQAEVVGIRAENAVAKTFRLRLPEPTRHLPGQHYVVRLTAPDGSQASRSYSAASAPDPAGEGPGFLELTVERIADGDVSPYLHDQVAVGDRVELRGPFGGWFVWRGEPALLVGGGSGVVPLMAVRRHWAVTGRRVPLHLVVSVREPADLVYAGEYGDETSVLHTRVAPAGGRPAGRLGPDDVMPWLDACRLLDDGDGVAYVCGAAGFAEHASQLLVDLGVDAGRVRVERFGPS